MTTYALNNLWSYLQGLTLGRSDREWLASKLLEPTKGEKTSEKVSEKSYKMMSISPDIKKWSGCASFTEEEIDHDPRLKAILSR